MELIWRLPTGPKPAAMGLTALRDPGWIWLEGSLGHAEWWRH